VVPGSERSVQTLKDGLMRQGAEIFHYKMMDIHASGHAYQEDLKLLINLVRPKFFIPVHGQYSMLKAHAELAESSGIEGKNIIIPQNGRVIKLTKNSLEITDEAIPSNYVMIDGLGINDVGEIVLRDREMLAKDGIFVVIAVIEGQTCKLKGSPDIISRGFVYLKESQELLAEARKLVKDIVLRTATKERTRNWSYVKSNLRDKVGEFLFQKTQKRPMVLPVIIEV
jgi:ribonuclease J